MVAEQERDLWDCFDDLGQRAVRPRALGLAVMMSAIDGGCTDGG